MLYAIAVYRLNGNKLEKKQSAVIREQSGALFAYNPLQNLEKTSLPAALKQGMKETEIYHFEVGNEHHYLQHAQNDHIRALVSRKKLDDNEVRYLFHNSKYVSLDKIMQNPLGYTGRDASCEPVQEKLESLRRDLLMVVDRALDRGEKLENLKDKALELKDTSTSFHDQTKKLSPCCSYW